MEKLQRQHVNQGKSIKCLREEWPFWFDELGMSVHFKELTGIDLKKTFTRNSLSYFEEESMFFHVEDRFLAEEVQLEQVPLTPAVIVCGQSCYSSKRYMLSLDQNLINTNISSFISALCLMFRSYCFNIYYPSELASTLEFLQRCFFSINPEKGTKVQNKNSKRPLNLNPRVLTLIQELSDHEWR
ncbi:uncharacterized protein LOC122137797 isoform X2 [Cyprinus carpio]|uniref:Uncharacterized protein LOC122137797 isoform X2 n=1 Tax=Cyprinus carpio TaxID=7962 RepID=A0A9Q9WGV0_CYPCA|nr:uncharacterized protein LOC122137797 isoform X2 [Cyprinus carpio]